MQKVENTASTLIASIQTQADHMSQLLAKFQEAEGTLEALSNEGHLDFITVSVFIKLAMEQFITITKNVTVSLMLLFTITSHVILYSI